ncbi:MAG: TIGR03086 family protein [SAR202 cluster bacterium]|nr:TIGR03086 family protein [SAR202 cluster bacterium]
MTQQRMPDPVELFERAVRGTHRYIANTRLGQMGEPTPCAEWNVRQLVEHIVGGPVFYYNVLSHGQDVGLDPAAGHLANYEKGTGKVIEAGRTGDTLSAIFPSPFGEMPGAQFIVTAALDIAIHGWDLAKATGQDTHLNAGLVEQLHAIFAPNAAMLRAFGAFGPEVPIPATGGTQERLLGALGRRA